MTGTILSALLSVIVAILLGALTGWRRDEDTRAAKALNTMVLTYPLPLALFAGTVTWNNLRQVRSRSRRR